jgi:alpha-L-glutamate ligase-like protein
MLMISPWQLSKRGILGINCRNRDFINRYNPRHLFPLVDNKLKTKLLAEQYQINTPKLLHVVRNQYEINQIDKQLASMGRFAIKPAKGSGGKGIWVIIGKNGDNYIKSSGAEVSRQDLHRHMSNTLAGVYSLAGTPDTILIEDLIECHESLREYSVEGVPDIRVIIFKGYPVMAMLRLATKASDGKANLHQGAVGVGLDISSGACLNAVQFSQTIEKHPDNGKLLKQIKVLDWTELLHFASRCYEMTGLGYLGVDMVLDQHKGPQLLELNARPGLAIQVANGIGLLPRLRHIESVKARHQTAEQRVAYAQQAFSLIK